MGDAFFRPARARAARACASIAAAAVVAFSAFTLTPVRQSLAQDQGALPEPEELKRLSIEQLMDIQVTTVSRRPERVFGAASAIQVITDQVIRRSGATRLPEALRLSPGLHVAQVNAHDWAITARGFNGAPLANNSLADKLLVMIDGRTVYTPLFGGVFWDVQNVLLEDVERIDVVRGPGGSLWGANAVNGVIHVVRKEARETQGVYVSAALGSFMRSHGALRYGGRLGERTHFRVYGQRTGFRNTVLEDGPDPQDGWHLTQGGFRIDFDAGPSSFFTVQGDVYSGVEGDPTAVRVNGQNVVLRWTHTLSSRSEVVAQVYGDRTYRQLTQPTFTDRVTTFDADVQHRFPIGRRHQILWGGGYRISHNAAESTESLSFEPESRSLHLVSGFVQDEIALLPEFVYMTAGTKLERHGYTGLEIQPNLRLAWTPTRSHTAWGAVSRAVRAPSRFDVDLRTPNVLGDRDFDAESVTAYEAGYRVRLIDDAVLSLATFYNVYHDLRSFNLNPDAPPPLVFSNDHDARAGGFELAGLLQPTAWWRLRGGYTYLRKKIEPASALVFEGSEAFEAIDPSHQALLQSMFDLPGRVTVDLVARFVDALEETLLTPPVEAYVDLDARVAWMVAGLEISAVGRNLIGTYRHEFGRFSTPRNVYGSIAWRI